jgi:hypothetical protein
VQPAVVEHTRWWLKGQKQQIINILCIVYSIVLTELHISWDITNCDATTEYLSYVSQFLKGLYKLHKWIVLCIHVDLCAHTAHIGFMFLWLLSQSMVISD